MTKNDFDQTLELNKSLSKTYLIACGKCLTETRHKVLASADVHGTWDEVGVHYCIEHQIVQCQGCDSISFRMNSTNSDDMDIIELPDGDTNEVPIDHEEIYPSRIAGRTKVKRYWLLPSQVSTVYNETHAALSNKLTILAGIGIRVLIESVCKEKSAVGSNLKERIDDLVSKGVLTSDGAAILHTLRDLGNESAHEFKAQKPESLDLAMDVVENLLQSVYILAKAARTLRGESEW